MKYRRSSSLLVRLVSLSLWSRYAHSFRIVLLTHANELLRPTNTGKLLLAKQQGNDKCEAPGSTEMLVWEGRGDNNKISEAVLRLSQPILVWTEAPKTIRDSAQLSIDRTSTYIILDGTWQEAKKMFRQGPDCLRSIPRISLEPSFQSTYKLRGNFGYVNRFTPVYVNSANDQKKVPIVPTESIESNTGSSTGSVSASDQGSRTESSSGTGSSSVSESVSGSGSSSSPGSGSGSGSGSSSGVGLGAGSGSGSGSNLLCTAEVGASLLLQHGHNERAAVLLKELETFQMTFQCYSTSK